VPRSARRSPQERLEACSQHFRSLEYHHVEVVDGMQAKLARLVALLETYEPNQDRQAVVISAAGSVDDVLGRLHETFEAADIGVITASVSPEEQREVAANWETGNIFVLVLADDISSRPDLGLGRAPAILLNLDLPSSVPLLLYRLLERSEASTRIHCLFSCSVDSRLVVPLMTAMEDAGHEMPADLVEMWSAGDQQPTDD